MIVIVVMGILAAIAVPSWFGMVERRAVDSATNQFAADLRLAHTKATNRLKEYAVVTDPSALDSGLTGTGADYYVIDIRSPITSSVVIPREFDEGGRVEVSDFGARFTADGSAKPVGVLPTTSTVDLEGQTGDPQHVVELNTTTSRVGID